MKKSVLKIMCSGERFIRAGWINRPKGNTVNTKYLITAVIVVLIVSAALIYIYNQGQLSDEEIEALHNLIDDQGYTTSLTAYPDTIVSVAPSCTEILFAIDVGDRIVAVTDYDNYPYDFAAWVSAGNMTSIGDFTNPNLEVITTLNPDLILASGGVQKESVETLRELGFKVLVLDPTNIEGVLRNIELVGNATGNRAEATALVNDINSRIEAVTNKVANAAKPKVYYEVYYESVSSWTIGAKAWQNELIEIAGGINVFVDQQMDYYQYLTEALITRNPDVIVLPATGMGTGELESLDDVKNRPGWNTINAVQNDRLYQIESNIIERAGPRVAEAIEQLGEFFHPELF
jgi:iron complex transport system substrate-binding protein